jgi:hypothetical protein
MLSILSFRHKTWRTRLRQTLWRIGGTNANFISCDTVPKISNTLLEDYILKVGLLPNIELPQ